ncbi:hypothetical protein [Nocardioides daeguensis]|uniref:hypothetical protein n=1 Tax=Nocardioides daeguensis TaxID=908359 RepID=UPI001C440C29|nr:hypothetical protein [Nocardioides daeguensis]MBV6729313.1 hypothetical protein [Nocardioides daeguensis]MCR1774289.1 hypothetical protein [Nocardioides daeguensis]
MAATLTTAPGSAATSSAPTPAASGETAGRLSAAGSTSGGPNAFRESQALDRRYLLSRLRWSQCRAVPVKVVGGPTFVHATRRAVARIRRATGLPLRVGGALDEGRGIRVRARAIRDSYTLGRTDLGSVGDELWRADIDIDVAETGRDRLVTVIGHELAHALGVRHAPRHVGDFMSPVILRGRLPYSSWDRAALRYAGQGRCLTGSFSLRAAG